MNQKPLAGTQHYVQVCHASKYKRENIVREQFTSQIGLFSTEPPKNHSDSQGEPERKYLQTQQESNQ